jgi:hypothetical protein
MGVIAWPPSDDPFVVVACGVNRVKVIKGDRDHDRGVIGASTEPDRVFVSKRIDHP